MAMPAILEGDVERFCDGMPGKPHIQAEIMSAVQDVEIERFRLEIQQLPASALQERMAFTHNGLFSRQWIMECDHVINGPGLREIFSIYMGLPSPACSGSIGQRLLTRKYLDPYGWVLHGRARRRLPDPARMRSRQDGH
jgi:hypothetical protein